MHKLYYSPGACSLAPQIVLEWIGRPYEAIAVDLHHVDDEYLAINPAGAVPSLVLDDGAIITQAAAVLYYLAMSNPELDLLPPGSAEHMAELVRWTAFFTGDLHPAFWPVFLPARYTKDPAPEALAQVKAAGLQIVTKKLALLEAQLQGRDWIVGDTRTMLDAYATPMLNWAAELLPSGLQPFPSLAAHRKRMRLDPAVRRALEAEGSKVED